jgi:hypothetical protein
MAGSTAATVTVADAVHPLHESEPFTFGRADDCSLRLDATDTGISRRAGSLEHEGGTWWLVNRSSLRPLAVTDELGFRSLLAPGRRLAVEAPVRVTVDGTAASHVLAVDVPRVRPASEAAGAGTATSVGNGVLVSEADRAAMVALFAGYLEDPPRYDPYPKSYAAAAARLGWPRTTLVKRIEYLRTRLTNAGVPNLTGWNALPGLAEYAITARLISKDDLRLIGR